MCASVGVRHPNKEGAYKHKGGWWDANEVALGNAASFSRAVCVDDGHNTGEILSKPRWQPNQSSSKVARSAQERRRINAGKLRCCNAPIKQKSSDWHKSGHPGVKRTLYFERIIDPTVSKELVRSVVRNCEACQLIDPVPVHWEKGDLSVKKNWSRLAMDITHYNGRHFLTLIDCGPSRFAVWQPLWRQNSIRVIRQLEANFYDRFGLVWFICLMAYQPL